MAQQFDWKLVHTIAGKEGVILRIQRRGDRRPQYSFQLGRLRQVEENVSEEIPRLLPFVPVRVEAQGSVTIDRQYEQLMKEAYDWVHEDAIQFENTYIEQMQERETRQINYGKQETRHTGKTDRNKDKKRVKASAD